MSADEADPVQGGCFCGAVRYQFREPIVACVNCHCTMCRRTSAAPFVSWVVVPQAQFEWRSGQAATLQSSADGTRFFCTQCGTPMVCINGSHPQWVDVTVGSLDNPEAFPPAQDVFEDTRLPWLPGASA